MLVFFVNFIIICFITFSQYVSTWTVFSSHWLHFPLLFLAFFLHFKISHSLFKGLNHYTIALLSTVVVKRRQRPCLCSSSFQIEGKYFLLLWKYWRRANSRMDAALAELGWTQKISVDFHSVTNWLWSCDWLRKNMWDPNQKSHFRIWLLC